MYKDIALSETTSTLKINKFIWFHESQYVLEEIYTNYTIMKKYKFATM